MRTTEQVMAEIRKHAEAAYPDECCGYLLGTLSESACSVVQIIRGSNQADGLRSRRFRLTPDSYLDASRSAEMLEIDVVGFYHSHPDHPARPSPTDLREASFPGFLYIIVSVGAGSAGEITAWTLAGDRSRFVQDEIDLRSPTNLSPRSYDNTH
jgi:proteasome lid subunit RPN8/RPN11